MVLYRYGTKVIISPCCPIMSQCNGTPYRTGTELIHCRNLQLARMPWASQNERMPGYLIEKFDSRKLSIGQTGGRCPFLYLALDYADEEEVITAIEADAPLTYRGLPRGGIDVTPLGGRRWSVTAMFESSTTSASEGTAGIDPGPQGDNNPDTGSPYEGGGNVAGGFDGSTTMGREMSFSTGGGTKHITQSRRTIRSAAAIGSGAAPENNKLIGYNPATGEVAGCEIITGSPEFTISRKLASFTYGYWLRLNAMTGTTNDAAYMGAGECELLFAGATGNYKDNDGWNVSWSFKYSKTERDIYLVGSAADPAADGTLIVTEKLGWHYMWVLYQTTVTTVLGTSIKISKARAAYVEEVYEPTNFNLLGL